MKSLIEFFPSWTNTLGWTLLHSLWQALVVMIVVIIALRMVPSKFSQWRYLIACAGMAIILVLNSVTFIYLSDSSNHSVAQAEIIYEGLSSGITASNAAHSPVQDVLTSLYSFFASNMSFIILCWITGSILFSLRIISGWWYVSRLKAEAVILEDQWSEKLQDLADQLGIHRIVSLAQSARIHSPVVIGFLKPMVLVPAGMLSGLSPEQIETIFIHELAHIRRHDYVVNLIQSFVEALFFFNPFVWIISNLIRREREYCCDDTVITNHRSAMAYAHALTQLEEVRLTRSPFALSLAENKNQLLNRIKRIMEKSAKNYSGRDRMIPAVLLVIGLVCASWLTIKADSNVVQEQNSEEEKIMAADTIDKKNQKSASYSKKTIITFDANGEPHEQVIESFEGDEALRSMMSGLTFDFHMPQFPPAPGNFSRPPAFHGAPGVPGFDSLMAPFGSFRFDGDTIPGRHFGFRRDNDWEAFSEEFEKKFREQFGDFYNSNEKDLEQMMKELEETFSNRFNGDDLENLRGHAWALADQARAMEEIQRSHREILRDAAEHAREAAEQAREHMEKWSETHHEELEKLEHERRLQAEQFREMEQRLHKMEVDMKSFEEELKSALVEDGYINKKEEIQNIKWDDDGEIEVNGKKIKEKDRKKYNDLHHKYFKKSGRFHYVE